MYTSMYGVMEEDNGKSIQLCCLDGFIVMRTRRRRKWGLNAAHPSVAAVAASSKEFRLYKRTIFDMSVELVPKHFEKPRG